MAAASPFANIPKIQYEGPKSKNPLAFKHYNPDEKVEGKTMKDHLRFSRALLAHDARHGRRHVRRRHGRAALGRRHELGREWRRNARGWRSSSSRNSARPSTPSTTATSRPRASNACARSNKNLDAVVKVLKEEQKRTGIKLLWGTACLFVHPRFMHGAATSCNADVFAYAAAQVKKALEVTHELGGEGYTFLGRPRRLHARC